MQNQRKVLVSALLKAEKQGYSNLILNSVLNNAELEDVSKAFVTSAFYGVLERKLYLDGVLNLFLKKPISKAPPYTAAVLRSAAYQILFMEKVPDSAAVNEAVKLIKRSKESGNSGLVNAVLRKITEKDFSLENTFEDNVKYSVEKWIYNSLLNEYGEEQTKQFLENSLDTPPTFIRINLLKIGAENIVRQEVESLGGSLVSANFSDCFIVSGIRSVEALNCYRQGLIFVQDYSSRICAESVFAKSGMRILDCCAAPGGKTFSIALNMQNFGEIYSGDIHSHRVDLIKKGAQRLGLDCIKPFVFDATKFNPELGEFDRVLCDVPCSGIGVIRRKPEIKYKSDEECKNLISIQKEILNTCSKYVKKGGRLIYSTCTLLKRENEEVVEAFLKENSEFSYLPVYGSNENAARTFMPPNDLGDGFFVACMERL